MPDTTRHTAGGLDPHRIAEVIVVTPAGRRRGSGYRVTATTVLTAAHVVTATAGTRVRFDVDRPGQWEASAIVAWHDPGSDVAVLTFVPPPDAPAVEPARFGRITSDHHAIVAVHAAGFPLWKQRRRPDGGQFRELHQTDGTVAALSNLRTGTLEITVAPAGADPNPQVSPWSGMSGAAVWAGDRIVGVVAEHHRWEGSGRLTAARIDHALLPPGAPPPAEAAALLAVDDPRELPEAGTGRPGSTEPHEAPAEGHGAVGAPARSKVIGLPVAHGIELFKNRTRELDRIGLHLGDPAIRMVTVTGRRGMGKSALAAKVMDLLDQGEWPGHAQAPLPSGLVNLSTRTSGISLERLYFDCAQLLGTEHRDRLHEIWATQLPVQDKLDELFAAMGDRLFVILMDNFEDLLHDDGRVRDEEVALFLDCLFRARSTPRLLITTQVPVRLAPELRRFVAQVDLAEGLRPSESVALLRELDRDGSLGIAHLPDEELLQAAVRVHGVPRALELLVGAMADDDLMLPTLQDILADYAQRRDVVAGLVQDRHRQLDDASRTVVGVLAALRTPVPQPVIQTIVGGLAPSLDVARILAHLARIHLLSVDRRHRTFALHPMDADLAYGELPADGPTGRTAVERRIADWYANTAPPRAAWKTADDVLPQRRQFDHLVRAGDYDAAAMVLGEMGEWLVWQGSVLGVISMHLAIDGRLTDDRSLLAHLGSFGHARLTAGPMEHAVELFTEAAGLAERLGDRWALQNAVFGLGDAYRQLGRLDAAVAPLARAGDLAHENGDTEAEVHATLSLSLAHSSLGDGETALVSADRLTELGRASGDALTKARAANARTIALLTLERWEETIASGALAARAYRAADSHEAITYALNAQGIALLALERVTEAVPVLQEALSEASLMENPRAEGVCLCNLAWAYWADGRYGQAAETAERAAVSLGIAGAEEAAAAQALAEAARARAVPRPREAADALVRAAGALGGTVEVVGPSWLIAQAELLRAQD
ncbi:trypsin-like peptidase domain-containing protein [Streptomyces sp. Je 1-79]|uniref:trypsin-like peptidase domain-containing protein n=1 Tax=Streptomyces sp. Je 1-79 TaxID=2943847 RepID=UPI0021A64DB6|nr:trypsin-like peptidase domain-containing protein [Streptomyces sp. Je 1-79]MCT4353037.1 trypsin-like peptidase domain-containing protein [Streptomyces sp. Je 1-79]